MQLKSQADAREKYVEKANECIYSRLAGADAEIALLHREVERLEGQITPLMVVSRLAGKVVNLMDDAATAHRNCVASIPELKGKEAISATKVLKCKRTILQHFKQWQAILPP